MKISTKKELHHRINTHPNKYYKTLTQLSLSTKKKKKKSYQIANTTKKRRNKLNKISPPYKTWTKLYYYYSLLYARPQPSISKIPSGCMDGRNTSKLRDLTLPLIEI